MNNIVKDCRSVLLASGTPDYSEMGVDFHERMVKGAFDIDESFEDHSSISTVNAHKSTHKSTHIKSTHNPPLPLSPLSTSHVIQPDQLMIQPISTLINGTTKFQSDFESSRKMKSNSESDTVTSNSDQILWNEHLLYELGESVLKIINMVPGGILVFFPSYGFATKCLSVWKTRPSLASEGGEIASDSDPEVFWYFDYCLEGDIE